MMRPQSSKAKGRRLQQWVASRVADATGFEYGKDCPIESRPMGQSGPDVRLSADVRAVFPFSVECKNQERVSLWEWVAQARKNRYADTSWLLVISKNRESPIVVLDADEFFRVVVRGGMYGREQERGY